MLLNILLVPKITRAPPGCCWRTARTAPRRSAGTAGGRVARRSPGVADPQWAWGEVCGLAGFGDIVVSKPGLPFAVLVLGEGTVGQGCPMGLWQPPVQPRLCSLPVLRAKEGLVWCKTKNHVLLFCPVMHFSLNNEVTNIEYLLNVHRLWLRGAAAACLHQHVQRLCWVHSGALWGSQIRLFLKKIGKLFVYWEGMAFLLLLDCLLPIPQQILCICFMCKYQTCLAMVHSVLSTSV